jgi:hypothetical protein
VVAWLPAGSDGRLHDVAVVGGVLSTDAVLGVLVAVVVLLVVELESRRLPMKMLLLLLLLLLARIVAADPGEGRVGVSRLLVRGIETPVVPPCAVITRTVEVVDAQHLDLLLLEALLLLRLANSHGTGHGLCLCSQSFAYLTLTGPTPRPPALPPRQPQVPATSS